MRRVHIIVALLLALLWVPSTSRCLLAGSLPRAIESCCDCEHQDGRQEGSCQQCVALESGVNLSSLAQTVAPKPAFAGFDDFAPWLQSSLERASEQAAELPRLAMESGPPPPRVVMWKKAQPVRGPSLVS
jgi:hypothetical protein